MLLERIRTSACRRRDHDRREDVRARASTSRSRTRTRSTPHGVPYFVSEFEESMTSFEHLQIQLETFVENVMFD